MVECYQHPHVMEEEPRALLCQVTQFAMVTGWNGDAGIKAWASGSH